MKLALVVVRWEGKTLRVVTASLGIKVGLYLTRVTTKEFPVTSHVSDNQGLLK